MSNYDVLRDALNALVERVATLEAVLAKQAIDPTYAHPAEIFGPNNDPGRVQSDLQREAAAANKREVDGPGPLASGQLASAGEATVPVGWKLAPGWEARHPEDYSECTWGLTRWQSGCQLRHAFQGVNGMACPIHAERMGAIVPDEPPAEQPSEGDCCLRNVPWETFEASEGTVRACAACGKRWVAVEADSSDVPGETRWIELAEQASRQETGETCPPLCGQIRTGDHSQCVAHLRMRESDKGRTCFCSYACRDRAKAKAAAQMTTECVADECECDGCKAFVARRAKDKAAEYESDRVATETTSRACSVDGGSWACGRCGRAGASRFPDGLRCPACRAAEPSGTGQLQSAQTCQCGHSQYSHINEFEEIRDCGFVLDGGDYCACARYREQTAPNPVPIAEPPAPAAGTLSLREAMHARINALESKLAQAERERDEARALVHDVADNCARAAAAYAENMKDRK